MNGVFLRDVSLATAGSGDFEGAFDESGLRNTLLTPVWLDSINLLSNFLGSHLINKGDVQVDVKLGRDPLTAGWVPTCVLAPLRKAQAAFTLRADSTPPWSLFIHNWRFPKPLLLLPGEALSIRLKVAAASDQSAATLWKAILRGRPVLGPTPTKRVLPYVVSHSSYDHMGMPDYTHEVVPVGRFGNPFNTTLVVEQFIGATNNFVVDDMLVRVSESDGAPIVRSRVPFATLFPPTDRVWDVKHALKPDEAFVFEFDCKGTGQCHIGMHSYREG